MNKLKKGFIIAASKSWNIKMAKDFITKKKQFRWFLIATKKDLNYQKIKKFKPRYIFFPHWSWIIPKKIYANYECVIFHMTDLPFGRGGSPMQNLIARGYQKTKITALKAIKELDAGPVYLKKKLSLEGSADQIFKRTATIIFREMIPYIVKHEAKPITQKGKIINFERRRPSQSNINKLQNLKKIYDYIRMLDAKGYPQAYLEIENYRIEFSKAEFTKKYILARAKILNKK